MYGRGISDTLVVDYYEFINQELDTNQRKLRVSVNYRDCIRIRRPDFKSESLNLRNIHPNLNQYKNDSLLFKNR